MITDQSTNDFREISRADGTKKRMSESKSKHDLIWSYMQKHQWLCIHSATSSRPSILTTWSDPICKNINDYVFTLPQAVDPAFCFKNATAHSSKYSEFCQGKQSLHNAALSLTLIILMWRIGWAYNNARKQRIGRWDVFVTVHLWYNYINNQLHATITVY